jgi:hypothetical protein
MNSLFVFAVFNIQRHESPKDFLLVQIGNFLVLPTQRSTTTMNARLTAVHFVTSARYNTQAACGANFDTSTAPRAFTRQKFLL